LANPERFPEDQREAVRCVIEELRSDGEEPTTFFASVEKHSDLAASELLGRSAGAGVLARIRKLLRRAAGKSEASACSDLRGVLLVDDKTACLYVFHLWHESAFADTGAVLVIGNPGGKCRDFYVDAKLNKVVRKLWWQ
jgi:hypothetical protein